MGLKPIMMGAALFLTPHDSARSRRALRFLMGALSAIDRDYIRSYPNTPELYKSGILYQPEVGTEQWRDIPTLLRYGRGDCEDLACWRIGELQNKNIRALPYLKWRKLGGRTIYHALVKLPDGRIEDPSRALGMQGHPITRAPVYIEP